MFNRSTNNLRYDVIPTNGKMKSLDGTREGKEKKQNSLTTWDKGEEEKMLHFWRRKF